MVEMRRQERAPGGDAWASPARALLAYEAKKGGRRRLAEPTWLDPIIYALDNRYYRIGAPIGVGYKEGERWHGAEGTKKE